MISSRSLIVALVIAAAAFQGSPGRTQSRPADMRAIGTVVIIYAENRSFDGLYGAFPSANGLGQASQKSSVQRDRDGSVMKELPPIWGGLTGKGVTPGIGQAQTEHLPNEPFAIDDPRRFALPLNVPTRDLWHRFYQNQMQIDGGHNDRFVAYADSGALVMGHYNGSALPMWSVARRYVLPDNFFMGAFGGSFLNHIWMICACVPRYPDSVKSFAKPKISVVENDGVTLMPAPDSPKSARDGPPKFVSDGVLTPDFYAVNTMQPPYQPSNNKPAQGGDPAYADPGEPDTLPPQTDTTIGDLLSAAGVSWAWYAGAWQAALDGMNTDPVPHFVTHHAQFNYFAAMAPGTKARREHLRDGGLGGSEFIKAIDGGALPQVAFYKPQGNLNEHPGNTDVLSSDRHIADLIAHLEHSPQWPLMLVIVTYDENGGIWDHAPPPEGDPWGPGSRVPAVIVSPFARRGFVDHTPYDTTSILGLITRRFGLPTLPGIVARDAAVTAHHGHPLGDLTASLDLPRR